MVCWFWFWFLFGSLCSRLRKRWKFLVGLWRGLRCWLWWGGLIFMSSGWSFGLVWRLWWLFLVGLLIICSRVIVFFWGYCMLCWMRWIGCWIWVLSFRLGRWWEVFWRSIKFYFLVLLCWRRLKFLFKSICVILFGWKWVVLVVLLLMLFRILKRLLRKRRLIVYLFY